MATGGKELNLISHQQTATNGVVEEGGGRGGRAYEGGFGNMKGGLVAEHNRVQGLQLPVLLKSLGHCPWMTVWPQVWVHGSIL